jgi:hypothetical protein
MVFRKFVISSDCDTLETVGLHFEYGVTVILYSIKSVLKQNPGCKVWTAWSWDPLLVCSLLNDSGSNCIIQGSGHGVIWSNIPALSGRNWGIPQSVYCVWTRNYCIELLYAAWDADMSACKLISELKWGGVWSVTVLLWTGTASGLPSTFVLHKVAAVCWLAEQ